MEFSAKQIASIIAAKIVGDENATVSGFNGITEAGESDLTFLDNEKFLEELQSCKASIILISDELLTKVDQSARTYLVCENTRMSLAQLLTFYKDSLDNHDGISKDSLIHETAQVGKNTYVGEGSIIGKNSTVGQNCKIHSGVRIGEHVHIGDHAVIHGGVQILNDTLVGNNVTIQSNATIGSDGFGFVPNSENNYMKIPHIGNVMIEDHVEIGANTCIDRATMGSTIIRKGVKLDNLIQIAHNVEIGENTVIAAQTGIAGSAKIGKNCLIGGQVGIVGHIEIADEVKIAAQSGIGHTISEKGTIVQGSPAFKIRDYKMSYVGFRKLPEILKKIDELEKKINE